MATIGMFDSGLGGIQTSKEFKKLYPQYDYLYLADTAHAPYGTKDADAIKKRTFQGLQRLFDHGASIVIVACNTAAAYSIRARQTQFPHLKALSVSVPGVEKMIAGGYIHIGILGTQATVLSGMYHDLFDRFGGKPDTKLSIVMAQELVTMIEDGEKDEQLIEDTIQRYLDSFPPQLDALVLGCTHFPIYMKYFQKLFAGVIIDPGYESAHQFGAYLDRHPDIKSSLTKKRTRSYYVTGDPLPFLESAKNVDHHIRSVTKA